MYNKKGAIHWITPTVYVIMVHLGKWRGKPTTITTTTYNGMYYLEKPKYICK